MAATGKKSKKTKWIKTNITEIIAEPTALTTANNWADSVNEEVESFGYASSHRNRAPVVLPSVSRAARGGMAVDDDAIPKRPPFIAHISNLPYDVDETAISELFEGLKIASLRLPREGDRLKGYGYVDFEDRESLIDAMNMPDLTVSGRRIRIEVSTHDNDRRGGMSRTGRNDREREYDPERTSGDWRSGPRAVPEPQRRETDRDRDRERPRDPPREREESAADNRPGGWRDGDRPAAEPARAPYGGRDSFGRDRFGEDRRERGGFGRENDRERGGFGRENERERGGYGGRDGFRAAEREGGGFGARDSRGFGSRGFGDRDRDPPPREELKPRERPKLNLLPRTVPREQEAPSKPADGAILDDKLEDKPAPKPVSAEKVFGAAKPVDTSAKEREIEERLRKQEEEARQATEEKERWTRKNDHSGERRAGARRDDRGKDTRSYNKDKRDYSKDDRDRRDYSRDNRDRRDYSKDDRDRHDYSREDRSRRDDDRDKPKDYPRDNRDRRDHSNDNRDSDRNRRDYSRDNRERDNSKDRNKTPERKDGVVEKDERNGRPRPSRSQDRNRDEDRPLPKLKEQEKPNFVASNKFSFLEDADDCRSD